MTKRRFIIGAFILCIAVGVVGYLAGQGKRIDLTTAIAAKAAGQPFAAENWMIAAAHPEAVRAGAAILAEGGSATDAMIAAQSVLGLVEPQSSGLGGGAFLVRYDAASGTITTLDGRETAPLTAHGNLFIGADGKPLKFFDAVVGGVSVGTPATPALMKAAHDRWGRLEWHTLFYDAITLAREGFTVTPRLAMLVAGEAGKDRLEHQPRARDYFFPAGKPIAAGQILQNPGYKETLLSLAADGGESFYHGAIADDIVATVQDAARNPGLLAHADLATYRVKERPAICIPYRGHDVCGMGPPSSGALTLGQILGMLGEYDLAKTGADSPDAWRLIGDASRLAFADRGRYMADSDFVAVPVAGLVDAAYLKSRAALLQGTTALEKTAPGMPQAERAAYYLRGDDESIEFPSTSHISIVDSYGNALSMTTTIENTFGSRLMTQGGFLLNNELTDFSFRATDSTGAPIANRIEARKRPRSSMSPTIVLRDGKPVLIIGSPGGSRIIGYTARAIIAHLDWGMDVQAAIAAPHLVNRFGTFDVEKGTAAEALTAPLTAMGYKVNARALTSGLHGIAIAPDGTLMGGADPRREGLAYGE